MFTAHKCYFLVTDQTVANLLFCVFLVAFLAKYIVTLFKDVKIFNPERGWNIVILQNISSQLYLYSIHMKN